MYAKFFGFKERPFRLVPNPHYLYLSKSHEEALAHLTYAVSQGDGFLTITGEVGTGKTTLCRSFIEGLDQEKVVAYIFNPKLDALQLLKAVNDEFEIPSDFNNTKDLIDALNGFLIEKKHEGKTVILLIDEAQNLDKDVLEQIRLLSNLETSKDKLLQIILVGQPELMDILDDRELRQLAQRITLSCHLTPFNPEEVAKYIEHRVNLASQKPQVLFSKSALRVISKYSNGIPRIINIICDRALLTACILNKKRINSEIVITALRELAGKAKPPTGMTRKTKAAYVLAIFFFVILAVIGFYPEEIGLRSFPSPDISTPTGWRTPEQTTPVDPSSTEKARPLENLEESPLNREQGQEITQGQTSARAPGPRASAAARPLLATAPEPDIEQAIEQAGDQHPAESVHDKGVSQPQAPENKPLDGIAPEKTAPPPAASPVAPPETKITSFGDYLKTLDAPNSRQFALETVLSLWKPENPLTVQNFSAVEEDSSYFVLASRKNGFSVQTLKNNFDLASRMNLPFILEIYWPEKMAQVYLAVCRMENDQITLKGKPDDKGVTFSFMDLKDSLGETTYIPWKNYYGYDGVIRGGSVKEAVLTLKMHLRDIGFSEVGMNDVYDETTRRIILDIQKKYHIEQDGLVGPMTKIALYNETASLKMPRISD